MHVEDRVNPVKSRSQPDALRLAFQFLEEAANLQITSVIRRKIMFVYGSQIDGT